MITHSEEVEALLRTAKSRDGLDRVSLLLEALVHAMCDLTVSVEDPKAVKK